MMRPVTSIDFTCLLFKFKPYALVVQAPIVLAKRWSCAHPWYTITMNKPAATPVVPPEEKSRTPGTHIGSASTSAQVKTQERCQGIWWGGELIWVDDLVQLRVSRCDLAPSGNDKVQPVAPSSRATPKHATKRGIDPERAPGPGDGVLFLRIMGIFFVEGTARISGMLFDLAKEGLAGAKY